MSSNLYGVETGQIYVAADGSKGGYVVTDAVTFADCDDVLVQGFTASGVYGDARRIDAFKLARVRYALVEALPEWALHLAPEINSLILYDGPGM
jgi:hypothetical protein